MKTRCLHCSYNFWSFLWHLKWLLDKGLTNGYCRIYGSCSLYYVCAIVCAAFILANLKTIMAYLKGLLKVVYSHWKCNLGGQEKRSGKPEGLWLIRYVDMDVTSFKSVAPTTMLRPENQ